jgi:hypothetical protein
MLHEFAYQLRHIQHLLLLASVVEQYPIHDHGFRHRLPIKVEEFESEGVFEQIVFPNHSSKAQ